MGIFERYRKVGLLGQGGMGQVYLGFDPVLERYVAIKQIGAAILEHPENATLLAYFEREAKVVAGLQHPNIIQVFEYGLPGAEPAYIVTEFVDGVTFEEIMEARPGLAASTVLSLLLPIAEALEYAHERDIIHRDLKPGNIMISRHGRIYLMDFGLAKPLGASGLKSMIIGSPAFMAPEQIEGKETDRKADVFAFGLLLYALATGDLFFAAEAPRAFVEILTEEYPQPEKLARLSDPVLVEIVTGCVQRDPRRRFSSMQVVVEIIEDALPKLGINSVSREIRRLVEGWLDLMPQQYTVGAAGTGVRDTSPVDASVADEIGLDGATPVRGLRVGVAISEPIGVEVDDDESGSAIHVSPLSAAAISALDEAAVRTPSDNVRTRVEPHAESAMPGAPAFHGASTVVLPGEGPADPDTPTQPRMAFRVEVGLPPRPVNTSAHSRIDDKTRRRLFVPTAPGVVGPRASLLEVPVALADSDSRLGALSTAPRAALVKRLLWLIAALDGEVAFTTLRPLLTLLEGADARASSEALAWLVGAGWLEQRGEDALALADDLSVSEVLARIGRDNVIGRSRGQVLTHFLHEGREALARCDDDDAETWLVRASTVMRADPDVPAGLVSDVLVSLSRLELERGRIDAARGWLGDAFGLRGLSAAAGVHLRLAYADIYVAEGRLERGVDAVTDAGTGARETGDAALIGAVAIAHAELQLRDADLRRAKVRLESLVFSGSDAVRVAMVLAEAEAGLGRVSEAVDRMTVALDLAPSDDVRLEIASLVSLGTLQLQNGLLSGAEERLEQARGTSRTVGLKRGEVGALLGLGELARLDGRHEEAIRLCRRAVGLAESSRDRRSVGLSQTALTLALAYGGELDAALRLLPAAEDQLAVWRFDRFRVDWVAVAVHLLLGDRAVARTRLERLSLDLDARGIVWPTVSRARATVFGSSLPPTLYSGYARGARQMIDAHDLSVLGLVG